MEQYVTVPMENNLLDGVMDVWDVRSRSVPGLSAVDLYFKPGTTMLHARQLVEERLTNAFSLPNVSKPPLLIQPLSSSSRVLMIGLSSKTLSPLALSYLARWVIKPRLSGVSGVANVAIFGQQDQQIQVQVDPSRLAAAHRTLSQIIDTAGNAQLVSPLTYLQGSTPGTGGFLDGPNQRLDIRPVLPLGAPSDLAKVPISGASGRLPLGSVTTVVGDHQPLIGDAVANQGASLVLEVQKLPSASVPGVTAGLDQALRALGPALTAVNVTSFFRPASYVSSAWHNLWLASIIAAALALLALAALLLDARAVAIVAVSVGLSLLSAVLLLALLGYSFNSLVALGLLIAVVVVVDDAVGATHDVLRRARQGAEAGAGWSIRDLVTQVCGELRPTLAYATMIVLLSAAPVFFSKGPMATFVHPMVLSFALAVIASMVVALTLTPALAMLLFDRGRPRPHGTAIAERVCALYEKVLRRAMTLRAEALVGVCALGLVGAVAFPFLHEPAPPTFKDRNLLVQWDGPAGTGLTEMDRVTQRAIGELRALPSVADAAATLGRAVGGDQIVDTSSGQIYVALRPDADYDRAVNEVRSIVESTPGMRASVSTYESDVMAGVLAPARREVTVRVYGEDYGQLRQLAGQVQGQVSRVNGLGSAQVQLPSEEPNIEVAVNDDAAVRAGVLPGDARRQASTLVSGLTVGNFFQNQAVFDVVVVGVPAVRNTIQSVSNLLIDTSVGGHVRLGDIAQVKVAPDPIVIQHQALSRYVDVSAPVYGGSVAGAQGALQRSLGQISFPLDYHAEVVGATPETPSSHATFLSYSVAALVGLLLLLQAAFGSWRLAAMFMLTLPVSLAGGLIVALATGQASSLASDAGLLAVFAFAVHQGILQIVHIRRRHARDGGPLTRSIVVRAAAERFPASMAAVLVGAAALLPFVVAGDVAGNELMHTAAAVILGGLVTTTLLNLAVVPAMCRVLGPADPIAVENPLQDAGDSGPVSFPSPSRS